MPKGRPMTPYELAPGLFPSGGSASVVPPSQEVQPAPVDPKITRQVEVLRQLASQGQQVNPTSQQPVPQPTVGELIKILSPQSAPVAAQPTQQPPQSESLKFDLDAWQAFQKAMRGE